MKQNEFYIEFVKLCKYYNSEFYKNEDITNVYFEKVKKYDFNVFKNICKNLMLESKYMPRISEFKVKENNNRNYTKEFLESFYDVGG